MKSARILSIPFLFVGLTGAASAFSNGPFSTGNGPSAPVGEEVWKLDAPRTHSPATRAQVVAELHKAERLGQISVGEAGSGEGDQALLKPYPNVSRAQILGELHEAKRLGFVKVNAGSPSTTGAQERMIAEAGHQAEGQAKQAAQ